ncbi:MAG: hypothetical protein QM786_02840 [Breznakibacter sp.]
MKRTILLTFFAALAVMNVLCQETANNFRIVGNDVIWQKVYVTSMGPEQLCAKAKYSGLFDKLEKEENKITGELKLLDADPLNNIPFSLGTLYITQNVFSGFVVIESKEGRYRVTLKRITLISKSIDTSKYEPISFLKSIALKSGKNEFTPSFTKNSQPLDEAFGVTFDFGRPDGIDDNW